MQAVERKATWAILRPFGQDGKVVDHQAYRPFCGFVDSQQDMIGEFDAGRGFILTEKDFKYVRLLIIDKANGRAVVSGHFH